MQRCTRPGSENKNPGDVCGPVLQAAGGIRKKRLSALAGLIRSEVAGPARRWVITFYHNLGFTPRNSAMCS